MGKSIVVTGKGGSGKTVLSALIVKALMERVSGTILAVDADPNCNLDRALGVAVEQTVGSIREDMIDEITSLPGGMTKAEYLAYRTRECLVETDRFDLIAMGRPEGPGCYCYANSILRQVVDKLAKEYDYVVIDCEAGLEHLSRRTAGRPDYLVVVVDPSVRSAETARRVVELTGSLGTPVGQTLIVANRCRDGLSPAVRKVLQEGNLQVAAEVPEDENVRALDDAGESLLKVPQDSPAYRAVRQILQQAGIAEAG
ncbi:MAG: AAA family ATPase [Armatimonadetes bacterium]|nr:AAA family ATPase [Armatimonadota bacterium]